MLSEEKTWIVARRGEYCLLDQTEGGMVGRTLFQTPSPMGKGVLVTPTADGNILIGPTSKDVESRTDCSTTQEGLSEVLEKAAKSVKHLPRDKIITSFAGIRAHHPSDDFIIEEASDVKGLINLIGIESPGLTAAPAIAEEAARIALGILQPQLNPDYSVKISKIAKFRELGNDERQRLIEDDPDYGRIICRCEKVTKAEILGAIRNPLGAVGIDSLKRRTRAGMGRCQSGFCLMKLLGIVAEETGGSLADTTKFGGGSWILSEPNKTSRRALQ
jgi:glycerol-3-phosphate dehydrogenase